MKYKYYLKRKRRKKKRRKWITWTIHNNEIIVRQLFSSSLFFLLVFFFFVCVISLVSSWWLLFFFRSSTYWKQLMCGWVVGGVPSLPLHVTVCLLARKKKKRKWLKTVFYISKKSAACVPFRFSKTGSASPRLHIFVFWKDAVCTVFEESPSWAFKL